MYRGRLKSGRGVFVKQVPASVWRYQWKQQQRFQGQFICDGESYVGEAAAAAFLTGLFLASEGHPMRPSSGRGKRAQGVMRTMLVAAACWTESGWGLPHQGDLRTWGSQFLHLKIFALVSSCSLLSPRVSLCLCLSRSLCLPLALRCPPVSLTLGVQLSAVTCSTPL